MTNEDWKKKFSKTKTMKIFFEPVLNGQLPSLKPLLVRRAVANEKLDLLCSHDDLRIIEPKLTGLLSNVDVPSLAADYMKFVSCLRRALNNIDNLYDLVLLNRHYISVALEHAHKVDFLHYVNNERPEIRRQ